MREGEEQQCEGDSEDAGDHRYGVVDVVPPCAWDTSTLKVHALPPLDFRVRYTDRCDRISRGG